MTDPETLHYCDRCGREAPALLVLGEMFDSDGEDVAVFASDAPPEESDWHELLHDDGSRSLICPGCITGAQRAAIEDAHNWGEAAWSLERCSRCRRLQPARDDPSHQGWTAYKADDGSIGIECPDCAPEPGADGAR